MKSSGVFDETFLLGGFGGKMGASCSLMDASSAHPVKMAVVKTVIDMNSEKRVLRCIKIFHKKYILLSWNFSISSAISKFFFVE